MTVLSAMSEHVTGVQTRFREVHWSAVYVHCHVFLSQCDFNVLLFTLKKQSFLYSFLNCFILMLFSVQSSE